MSESQEEIALDEELFTQALEALENAEQSLSTFESELKDIDTGLAHSDTIALLYGRSNLTKTEIRSAFDALDDISSKSKRTLVKRLIADQSRDVGLNEAEVFLNELDRLRQHYGDKQ